MCLDNRKARRTLRAVERAARRHRFPLAAVPPWRSVAVGVLTQAPELGPLAIGRAVVYVAQDSIRPAHERPLPFNPRCVAGYAALLTRHDMPRTRRVAGRRADAILDETQRVCEALAAQERAA